MILHQESMFKSNYEVVVPFTLRTLSELQSSPIPHDSLTSNTNNSPVFYFILISTLAYDVPRQAK